MDKGIKTILGIGVLAVLFVVYHVGSTQGEFVVHLSFEASNDAPVSYKMNARVLPIAGSQIIFTADLYRAGAGQTLIPQNPANYIFEWTWRSVPKKQLGKPTFLVTLDTIPDVSSADIRLRVLDRSSEDVLAENSLSIPVASPEVLLYEVKNGIVKTLAPETFGAKGGETITILAQPYFFNAAPAELDYEWRHRGSRIEGTPTEPQRLEIRIPAGAGGSREQFSVTVSHREHTLERISKNFIVEIQ